MAEPARGEAVEARPAPPDPRTLEPRQRARRDRIVQATLELMVERDFESLQMKDVTVAAGAALGTVYRYFSSKEHLVAEALLAWAAGFEETTEMAPARSIDRLKLAYRRAARAFERAPRLYDHLMAVEASTDPNAVRVFGEFARRRDAAFAGFLPRVPSPRRERIVNVMDAVLAANLRAWSGGRLPIAAVYRALDSAAELLLGSR
ncbi:MAG TPA: helix-turn-helix domain-containing protein [Acidimicrobiia bacterium]|nr:helix-turn-helix domain-containing protein [Acidimicrobiia bacterium]